jgi:L-asparaginase
LQAFLLGLSSHNSYNLHNLQFLGLFSMPTASKTTRSIYVAYTGGTIGMQKTDNGFVPVAGFLTDCVNFTMMKCQALLSMSIAR